MRRGLVPTVLLLVLLGAVGLWRLSAGSGDDDGATATYVPRSTTTAVPQLSDAPTGGSDGGGGATTTTALPSTSPSTGAGPPTSVPPTPAPGAVARVDPQISVTTTTTVAARARTGFDPSNPASRSSGVDGGTS